MLDINFCIFSTTLFIGINNYVKINYCVIVICETFSHFNFFLIYTLVYIRENVIVKMNA